MVSAPFSLPLFLVDSTYTQSFSFEKFSAPLRSTANQITYYKSERKTVAKYYFSGEFWREKRNIPCNSSGKQGEKEKKWQTNCVCNVVYESISRSQSKKRLLACSQRRHFFSCRSTNKKTGKKLWLSTIEKIDIALCAQCTLHTCGPFFISLCLLRSECDSFSVQFWYTDFGAEALVLLSSPLMAR